MLAKLKKEPRGLKASEQWHRPISEIRNFHLLFFLREHLPHHRDEIENRIMVLSQGQLTQLAFSIKAPPPRQGVHASME